MFLETQECKASAVLRPFRCPSVGTCESSGRTSGIPEDAEDFPRHPQRNEIPMEDPQVKALLLR